MATSRKNNRYVTRAGKYKGEVPYKKSSGKLAEYDALVEDAPVVPPYVRLISDMDNPAEWGYDYDLLE